MDKRNDAQQVANCYKKVLVNHDYRHFKGNMYRVLDVAVHSETAELLVIYMSMDGSDKVWARPLKMFIGPVDKDKYPDVKQSLRFERVK